MRETPRPTAAPAMPNERSARDDGVAEASRFGPVLALLTVSAMWDARLAAELKPLGLTTRKYALLGHIGGSPDISFSELARRSLITVQSVHAAVGALSASGLVEDATAHAGAASALRVTPSGQKALDAANAVLLRLDAAFAERAPGLSASLRGLHEDPDHAAPDAD